MYTPKIKEDLIRKLYQQAKAKGIPMTKLVNQIIRDALKMGVVKSETQRLLKPGGDCSPPEEKGGDVNEKKDLG